MLVHAGSTTIGFVDYGAPAARHAEQVNLLWADGHVKPMKVEQFYTRPGMTSTNPPPPAGAAGNWSPCLDPAYGCP
jgi:prepilin-type processing-associated H-X9-DG protein